MSLNAGTSAEGYGHSSWSISRQRPIKHGDTPMADGMRKERKLWQG